MIDSDFIQNAMLSASAVVPIIVALVQMFKMTNWVQERFAPFLSVGIGIIVAFLLIDNFRGDISGTIFTGILYGLSASGLYSGIKTTAHAIKMDKVKNKNSGNKDNF
jgi:hypothetical protein